MMRHFALPLFILCLQIQSIYTTSSFRCFSWDTQCLSTALPKNLGQSPWISELDAMKADPFEIDYFKLEKDGLIFETRNTKGRGLKNMVIDELRADPNTSMIYMKIRTDLFVTGLYKAAGSLFYLPLNGEGDYWASFKNVEIDVQAPFSIVRNANGEDYIQASNYKFKYDVKDNAEFRLNNFYYGFSGFSELLHSLVNNNWKYISTLYANDFIANAVETLTKTRTAYFRLQPFKMLLQ